MLLTDVMRHLNNEYAIRFLLAAYIESLCARDMRHLLPAGVGTLPLRGAYDIETRFAALLGSALDEHERVHDSAPTAMAKEATEIFGAAVARLHALNQNDDDELALWGGMQPAHTRRTAVAAQACVRL